MIKKSLVNEWTHLDPKTRARLRAVSIARKNSAEFSHISKIEAELHKQQNKKKATMDRLRKYLLRKRGIAQRPEETVT